MSDAATRPPSVIPVIWVLASCAVFAACTGSVGDSPGTSPGAGSPGSRGKDEAAPPVGPPSPDTGLWRLTRTEYRNTIRDLLGDTSQAGNALGDDTTAGIFDNNAEILRTSAVEIEKYDDVAAGVVESAFADRTRRSKLLTAGGCANAVPTEACARSTVAAFARRAWRRPIDDDELDGTGGLLAALAAARAQGDTVEEGIKLALRMVLTAPSFLYRVEDGTADAQGLHQVGPHELATRLSYFVWSSTPDDELLDLADRKALNDPATFSTQLQRLLADGKADALVANFASQWLSTRTLASVMPDARVLKYWKEELRKPMIAETQSFFREFLQRDDLPLADLLDTNFTFANEALAKHYGSAVKGFPAVAGTGMQRVSITGGTHRFGLLSQAGILAVTSKPDRTSPVNRGKWVLSRLLCEPPSPPPAKTPTLDDSTKAAALPPNATIRARMSAHRTPACASCHAAMDSVGFGFEHYDAIGMWRDSYPANAFPSSTIDASGKLSDGSSFDGLGALSGLIRNDPRFLRCFARTVFTYALGRDPTTDGDRALIDRMSADLAKNRGRIRDVIAGVASSPAFQFRGAIP